MGRSPTTLRRQVRKGTKVHCAGDLMDIPTARPTRDLSQQDPIGVGRFCSSMMVRKMLHLRQHLALPEPTNFHLDHGVCQALGHIVLSTPLISLPVASEWCLWSRTGERVGP